MSAFPAGPPTARHLSPLTFRDSRSGDGQALHRLTGDPRDHVEVLVDVQNRSAMQFSGSSDEQVWDRWSAMVATDRKDRLDGKCPLLYRGRHVVDRHAGQGRRPQHGGVLGLGSSRVADLEQRQSRHMYEAPFYSLRPDLGFNGGSQTDNGRLVDQPCRAHDHAARSTSSSCRSCANVASLRRSSTVTRTLILLASDSNCRRKYSEREIPSRVACSSNRARSSSGKLRISRSGMTTPPDSTRYHALKGNLIAREIRW